MNMYRSGVFDKDSKRIVCMLSSLGREFISRANLGVESLLGVSILARSDRSGVLTGDWILRIKLSIGGRELQCEAYYSFTRGLYFDTTKKTGYLGIFKLMRGDIFNMTKMLSVYRVPLYAVVIKIRNCRSTVCVVDLPRSRVGIIYEGSDLPADSYKYNIFGVDLSDLSDSESIRVTSL